MLPWSCSPANPWKRLLLAELFGFLIDGLGELSDIRPAVYHVALQVIGAVGDHLAEDRAFVSVQL
ncbi:MAG: hypothetical protein V8Q79_02795 [Christensenellales bacterium]